MGLNSVLSGVVLYLYIGSQESFGALNGALLIQHQKKRGFDSFLIFLGPVLPS